MTTRFALTLGVLVLTGLAAVVTLVLDEEPSPRTDGPSVEVVTLAADVPAADRRRMSRPNLAGGPPTPMTDTTPVATPLVVAAPTGHFGPTVPREGRTSLLRAVVRIEGEPVPAELTFVAGPEAGRTLALAADAGPEPVAVDPGFALVEVRASTGDVCRRELRLDHRRTLDLDLDFAHRGVLVGRVQDEDGAPISGARVGLDGVDVWSDADGRFRHAVRVSGAPLLVVEAPGRVLHREALTADAWQGHDDKLVSLQPGSSLVLGVSALPGVASSEPVLVQVFPTGGPMGMAGGRLQSLYPWERLNPIRIPLGGQVTLDGLPPCKLEIVALHASGASGPQPAFIVPGNAGELELSLTPHEPVRGRVVRDGEGVPGADVSLVVPNPVKATHRVLGGLAQHTRRVPVAHVPQATQHVVTDADGWFVLARDERLGQVAYLTVRSPEGELEITRELAADESVTFDLDQPGA